MIKKHTKKLPNLAPHLIVTSKFAGVNWYLRGNTTKVGIVYQKDEYDIHIGGENTGNEDATSLRVTSQWLF